MTKSHTPRISWFQRPEGYSTCVAWFKHRHLPSCLAGYSVNVLLGSRASGLGQVWDDGHIGTRGSYGVEVPVHMHRQRFTRNPHLFYDPLAIPLLPNPNSSPKRSNRHKHMLQLVVIYSKYIVVLGGGPLMLPPIVSRVRSRDQSASILRSGFGGAMLVTLWGREVEGLLGAERASQRTTRPSNLQASRGRWKTGRGRK